MLYKYYKIRYTYILFTAMDILFVRPSSRITVELTIAETTFTRSISGVSILMGLERILATKTTLAKDTVERPFARVLPGMINQFAKSAEPHRALIARVWFGERLV